MSAAIDAVVRAWLVVAAWVGLLRPLRLARLARIRRPMSFIRAAIVPAGGIVAVAIALLPRKHRREAAISFLAGKALVAFDDDDPAAATERITAAVQYLTGESPQPPHASAARSTRARHRLEALLAARLPLLRAAIKLLPGDAVRRCCAVVERIGDGLIQARVDRRCGVGVFGSAVVAAARLVVPAVRPPVFACNAAGRALQLARELHDAELHDVDLHVDLHDTGSRELRDRLIYQALQELPTVPRLLRWLPASTSGGTRGAAALLAVATYRFYLEQIEADVPRRLRHPLGAALSAAMSRDAYIDTVAAIEDGLHDALDMLAVRDARIDSSAPALPAPSAAPPLTTTWH